MKYFVTVNGREREVVLTERRGRLEVTLDGAPIEVRHEEVDRLGQVALFVGDHAYAVSIEGTTQESTVTVAGHLYRVEVEDERERAAHAAERERAKSGGDVKSVMPGVVVELLVAEGDTVEEGQPLLILEAMKMQNEIEAPSAGRVKRLHVEAGEAVASGAKLITLVSE
ncbi:MAG: biotin/lipoyl-containing protein [Planctomycetota bacterium]